MTRRPALLVITLVLAALPASAQNASDRRTISVSGEGEVKAAPDLAVLSFAVETTAPEAGAAVAENARKSTALAAAIKQQLGPKDQVSTTGYQLDPIYEQRDRMVNPPTAPNITGYIARNEVMVQTRSLDTVGKLIDAATKAGANRVNGLSFTLEQRDAAQSAALQKAGQDARRQADEAARALGVKIVRVVSATTGSPGVIMPRQYKVGMAAMAESDAMTPVEAGDVSVHASLQVTYEIE